MLVSRKSSINIHERYLVCGFNPFEKSNCIISPGFGVKIKKYLSCHHLLGCPKGSQDQWWSDQWVLTPNQYPFFLWVITNQTPPQLQTPNRSLGIHGKTLKFQVASSMTRQMLDNGIDAAVMMPLISSTNLVAGCHGRTLNWYWRMVPPLGCPRKIVYKWLISGL